MGRRVVKRRRDLFNKDAEPAPQDDKVALLKCMVECGFRFGVPFHVIRDRADVMESGFECPRCDGLRIRWENYEVFEISVDERKGEE